MYLIRHGNLYIYTDNYYKKTSHCICLPPLPIKKTFCAMKKYPSQTIIIFHRCSWHRRGIQGLVCLNYYLEKARSQRNAKIRAAA
jgi:hypothetical protein